VARGGVSSLATCGARWRHPFEVVSRPSFTGYLGLFPGVRSVWLLHTTSSFNGHWVRGLFGLSLSGASPSAGFGYLFEDLVGGILAVGVSVLQVVLVGAGAGC
jgi:hypothetical protein